MDNRVQALRCKAFRMAVKFSPMHYNEGMRFFVGAASATKHVHHQAAYAPVAARIPALRLTPLLQQSTPTLCLWVVTLHRADRSRVRCAYPGYATQRLMTASMRCPSGSIRNAA